MDDRKRDQPPEEKDPASGRSIPRGTDEHAGDSANDSPDDTNRGVKEPRVRADAEPNEERDRPSR
jgi:hypothetical protein